MITRLYNIRPYGKQWVFTALAISRGRLTSHSRWWFYNVCFFKIPLHIWGEIWGEMIQFDRRRFFKWMD